MAKALSIYVHVPFCVRKCAYCDFLSHTPEPGEIEVYFSALEKEIRSWAFLSEGRTIKTVFFGGGTPSFVPAKYIAETMAGLRGLFTFDEDAEVTIEANPGTFGEEKLQAWRDAGINRLSIGLQSADDGELRRLGRIHSYEEFEKNYYLARKHGYNNINVDLMSALPGQTVGSWRSTLEKVSGLGPEHISAYSLIIEEGTPFYELYGGGHPYGTGEHPSGTGECPSGMGERSSGRGGHPSGMGERTSGRGECPSGMGERSSGRGGHLSGMGERTSGRGEHPSSTGGHPSSTCERVLEQFKRTCDMCECAPGKNEGLAEVCECVSGIHESGCLHGTPGRPDIDMKPDLESDEAVYKLPSEEDEREMYRLTKEHLASCGYNRYEISNYSRPGFESRHNMVYWTCGDYIGLGLGASSFVEGRRFTAPESMEAYLRYAEEKKALEAYEPEPAKDMMEEFMFLGLRMTAGVSLAEFEDRFSEDRFSEDRFSEGRFSEDRFSEDRFSEGRSSEGWFSEGRSSEGRSERAGFCENTLSEADTCKAKSEEAVSDESGFDDVRSQNAESDMRMTCSAESDMEMTCKAGPDMGMTCKAESDMGMTCNAESDMRITCNAESDMGMTCSAESGKLEDGLFRRLYGKTVEKHTALGLLEQTGGRLRLTDRGIDVSNVVLADFLL